MSRLGYHKLTILNSLIPSIFAVFAVTSCAQADGGHAGPRLAAPAPNCGALKKIDKILNDHDEVRLGYGRAGSRMVEIYINERTGTWTMVVHLDKGMACIPLEGQGWVVTLGHVL